jgi:hypothetical protein
VPFLLGYRRVGHGQRKFLEKRERKNVEELRSATMDRRFDSLDPNYLHGKLASYVCKCIDDDETHRRLLPSLLPFHDLNSLAYQWRTPQSPYPARNDGFQLM